MMGYGEKNWESFPMMSALDFVKCYDDRFLSPDEYINKRISDLNAKSIEESM